MTLLFKVLLKITETNRFVRLSVDRSRIDFLTKGKENYSRRKKNVLLRLICRKRFWTRSGHTEPIGTQINIRPPRIPGDIGDQKEGVVRNYQIADN